MLDRETLSTKGGTQDVVAPFVVSMLKLRVTDCVLEVLFASTIVVAHPAPSATCGMIWLSANAGSSPTMRKDAVRPGTDRIVIAVEYQLTLSSDAASLLYSVGFLRGQVQ